MCIELNSVVCNMYCITLHSVVCNMHCAMYRIAQWVARLYDASFPVSPSCALPCISLPPTTITIVIVIIIVIIIIIIVIIVIIISVLSLPLH